jgi:HD-GYP domain-containing protein (c-di-GMP phosphodiesterase class II)
LLGELAVDDVHAAVLAAEPRPHVSIHPGRLPDVAESFGDIADLKSPWFLGHSRGVALVARDAAARLGLDDAALRDVYAAGLLHDLGRVGISNAVWERAGPLSAPAWEQVRLHPYHSERILARSRALRPLADIAGRHHERLDGSGYHRGSAAREIPLPARVLATADAYQAMTQARPHRAAISPDEAAGRLRDEARAGRIDTLVATAVLDAAGHRLPRVRAAVPAGLSDREVEVLRAVAGGLTNRQIAERFSISPRTAEHHVQHIYTKVGVSSRAAAALFAMEHGLID